MKKPYTKHKKNTKKKPDLTGAEWKPLEEIGQYKTKSQLDRIERKLDELLNRLPVINITPRPGEWYVPYQINTTTPPPTEQPRYPTDPFGQPVPYAVSIGGER